MLFTKKRKIEEILNAVYEGKFVAITPDQADGKDIISNKALSLGNELKEGKKKVSEVLKGVIGIATIVSNFYLKMSFFSKKINTITEKLSLAASNVSAASEETTASITQVVDSTTELVSSLERISSESDKLNENTKKSNTILEQVKNENSDVLNLSGLMKTDVITLLETVKKIRGAVEGIYGISEQTNLLALNASIEAARAGEAGRGFAVVADEIRKLSDTTKSLLESMNELLEEVDQASHKSYGSVDKTVESLVKVNSAIESMSEIMTINSSAINHISDSLTSIAASNEEVNASLEEVASAMNMVSTDAQGVTELSVDLETLGKSVQEMSLSMGEVEGKVVELADSSGKLVNHKFYGLSNEDFINALEAAINAHMNWLANLKQMADNMKVVPIQTDEHSCGFGHFYYAVKPASKKILPLWNGVEEVHRDFHKKGDIVITDINQNDKKAALEHVKEAEQVSNKITGIFNEMVKIAKEMNLIGEQVF